MMIGLFAVAHDFILVAFEEKWLAMETVLKVFCLIGLMQSIATTVGVIYLSTGRTRLMLRVSMYATPFIVASFAVGLPWGIEGVAIAYGLVTAFLLRAVAHLYGG
jgi:PST family polysaccharide transporter